MLLDKFIVSFGERAESSSGSVMLKVLLLFLFFSDLPGIPKARDSATIDEKMVWRATKPNVLALASGTGSGILREGLVRDSSIFLVLCN